MASQKSTHFPAYGGSTTEQSLVQDLVDEHIKIHGSTVFYLPRTLNDVDQVWGEASNSEFKESVEIEMYLKSYNEMDNDMADTVTEFGLSMMLLPSWYLRKGGQKNLMETLQVS